ncbi:hypothetical protein [Nostoc sp.]|uniref:hypothetical protein n=1 Tax=Nostoc sp. TaxID=1180 RepID=UPI002FF44819
MWEAPGRGKKRSWQESNWQAIVKNGCHKIVDERARQLSQKLLEERNVELGAEQIRQLLKGVVLETHTLQSSAQSKPKIPTS